jgi:hypothetical protein
MSATPSSGSIDGKIDPQDLLFSRIVGPGLVPRIDIRIGTSPVASWASVPVAGGSYEGGSEFTTRVCKRR